MVTICHEDHKVMHLVCRDQGPFLHNYCPAWWDICHRHRPLSCQSHQLRSVTVKFRSGDWECHEFLVISSSSTSHHPLISCACALEHCHSGRHSPSRRHTLHHGMQVILPFLVPLSLALLIYSWVESAQRGYNPCSIILAIRSRPRPWPANAPWTSKSATAIDRVNWANSYTEATHMCVYLSGSQRELRHQLSVAICCWRL